MGLTRFSRRRKGITKTDIRRDGLEATVASPSVFNQPVTDGSTVVFNLLNGHATLGSGMADGIVTKCSTLVFNLLTAEITQ